MFKLKLFFENKQFIVVPKILLALCCTYILSVSYTYAQDQNVADSLKVIYEQNNLTDTAKFKLLSDLAFNELQNDSLGLQYAQTLIDLAQKAGNKKFVRMGYFLKGTKWRSLGESDNALEAYLKSATLAAELKNSKAEAESYCAIGDVYSIIGIHKTAMHYYNIAINTLRRSKDSISLASSLANAGDEYYKVKKFDSALIFFEEAKVIFEQQHHLQYWGYTLGNMGRAYASIGRHTLAEKYMNEAIRILEVAKDYYPICDYLHSIAEIYKQNGDYAKAMILANKGLQLAKRYNLLEQMAAACLQLSQLYELTGNTNEALKCYKSYINNRDSLYNIPRAQKIAELEKNFALTQKQAEINLLNAQKKSQKIRTIALVIILSLTLFSIGMLLKYYRNKQKAFTQLNLQKQETEIQKDKAEKALNELTLRQKQLIQNAKMASLGEVTSGIAHEIQNPLNFVNNFTELSADLLQELRNTTVAKLTPTDKAEAEEILDLLNDNFKKINDHGKRADAIVKNMLQHSRTSTGNKEPTDINALIVEYLKLSYHGMRAKDKDFSARFHTQFDENIGTIEIVPQDIGRVLLNLLNNAFYAVHVKQQHLGKSFEPEVNITTRREKQNVIIVIQDNGNGIPENILEKIFQPFFTTKPTGQGTGLGLSISYDIIKSIGGDITVQSAEGEYCEFTIQIPCDFAAAV